MKLLFAALFAAGQAFAQQAPPQGKTTEQQARSYIATAFITGAAPAVLSDSAIVSPEVRQRLGVAPEADSRAVYEALVASISGKAVLVRPAAQDEIVKAEATSAPGKPMFALESGDATLILQYDLDRDHIAFIGVPRAAPVAAPVVAPAPPQPVAPEPVPAAAVQAPEPPVQKAEPPAKPEPAGLQMVEPQIPRVVKPVAAAPPPVQPAATARAPETRPLLRKSGPCEIKPVMTDQDLVNCGATPR